MGMKGVDIDISCCVVINSKTTAHKVRQNTPKKKTKNFTMLHETTTPSSPFEQDRLFLKLAKGKSRATQVTPSYTDFRLGHGDPLLKATMRHDLEMASPQTKKKRFQKPRDYEEIHLIQRLSPLGGVGINDVVHIDKNTVMSIPIIPTLYRAKEHREVTASCLGIHDRVHLPNGQILSIPMIPITSPAGDKSDYLDDDDMDEEHEEQSHSWVGINDIDHLPDGEILSVPMIPSSTRKGNLKVDRLAEHGAPLSGLGMSDIVHLGKNQVLSIPCLPNDRT